MLLVAGVARQVRMEQEQYLEERAYARAERRARRRALRNLLWAVAALLVLAAIGSGALLF